MVRIFVYCKYEEMLIEEDDVVYCDELNDVEDY